MNSEQDETLQGIRHSTPCYICGASALLFYAMLLLFSGPRLLLASSISEVDVPVIQSVTLSENAVLDGGTITVTVTVSSNAPVNRLSRSLDGPRGSIYGGGSGATFVEISPGTWQYAWVEVISQWAPSGTYTYSNISVQNEGRLISEPWPPLTFIVSNEVFKVNLPLLLRQLLE